MLEEDRARVVVEVGVALRHVEAAEENRVVVREVSALATERDQS